MRTPRWLARPMLWVGVSLIVCIIAPLELAAWVLGKMATLKPLLCVTSWVADRIYDVVGWLDEQLARIEMNYLDVRWVKDDGRVDN